MEGILRSRKNHFAGILNGISYEEWSPKTDNCIIANFSREDISGKNKCKEDLQLAAGLPRNEKAFLIGAVSRLDPQKGYDLVNKAMPMLMQGNIQFAFLGNGDKKIFQELSNLSKKYPDKISFTTGFNEPLAHKIYAGADAFLMPSIFEPCGLGQMIALSYGTIPIVHRTGGLSDTVTDYNIRTGIGNGFSFLKIDHEELAYTIKLALKIFNDKKAWSKLVANAFCSDFSWKKSIKEYIKIYKRVLESNK
jgi:starch synthase